MKSIFTPVLSFLLIADSYAQVQRTVVVEHFTNTRCSICASRNPGFYSNLANQENTLHIAFHPSSPYPSCILNEYNMAENDGRTNYYGLFGSTPDFVIQGSVIPPSSNFSAPALFAPFEDQMSPASIRISHTINGNSVTARISIITEADNSLDNLRIFAALKEDVVNYNAPNGENVHYDVFRDSYFGVEGEPGMLASNIGDSVVFMATLPLDTAWDLNNVSSLVIVQDQETKEVIQASELGLSDIPLANSNIDSIIEFKLFPNPANSILYITTAGKAESSYEVFNALGKMLASGNFKHKTEIDVRNLAHGIYFIKINQNGIEKAERLLIKK